MSESIEAERPETLTLTLRAPILFQNGSYDTLILREPTVKEMLNAEGQCRRVVNMETLRLRDIHLLAGVAGWPVPVVEKLPISILDRAAAFLLGFSEPGQRTGAS